IHVQTNGTLLDSEFLDIADEHGVGISISLDGPREVHDRHRVGFSGEGSFESVLRAVRLVQSHPKADALFSGVLAVVDATSDPEDVYGFFKELGPPSVDFIFRDGNHEV